ncbi:MAG: hypothetical protein RLO52_04095 [Sandaracinaceae bacterium]|nr:MAG: hypothetical protein EVA89_14510 [Sandaracinaceae bacterium]HBQ10720.1 hypothetical protein [Myxococcales bacterium]
MSVPEQLVQNVVFEVSQRMSDPTYAQLAIGNFAESHPDAGRYIALQLSRQGGDELVVTALFHAEVIHQCFRRHLGRDVDAVGFPHLDRASQGDIEKRCEREEPALASYVASNADDANMRKLLALVTLAMNDAA